MTHRPIERLIWHSILPSKIKMLMSKVGMGTLPVRLNLHRRIQRISPHCSVCGEEEESIEHCLFECPSAHMASDEIFPHMISWFHTLLSDSRLSKQERRCLWLKIAALCWQIWIQQNQVFIQLKIPNPPSYCIFFSGSSRNGKAFSCGALIPARTLF